MSQSSTFQTVQAYPHSGHRKIANGVPRSDRAQPLQRRQRTGSETKPRFPATAWLAAGLFLVRLISIFITFAFNVAAFNECRDGFFG